MLSSDEEKKVSTFFAGKKAGFFAYILGGHTMIQAIACNMLLLRSSARRRIAFRDHPDLGFPP